SVVLIVVGAVAFASDWSAGVLARKARAARSICSRFALIADKNVRAPVANSHALRAGTPPLQSMANFPLAFEANAGQADPSVKFLARAGKSELLLTSRAVTVQSRESFGVQFVAANAAITPQGIDILSGQRNYIVGNDPS